MAEKNKFGKREKKLRTAYEAVDLFLDACGGKERRHLCALWDNWSMVLGDDLAGLAFPLGHKERILHIGAEDSMALQELSLQSPEILERVNAFMDTSFFTQVRVILLQGQRPLTEKRSVRNIGPLRSAVPPRPPRLGSLNLPPDSLVGRCYEAYLAVFS